ERAVLVPHGCDAMTRADFRRRGILSALGARANAVWRQAGAPFQIGFHYGGWGSVREQLGWRPTVRLMLLKCHLRPLRTWLRRMGRPGLAAVGQRANPTAGVIKNEPAPSPASVFRAAACSAYVAEVEGWDGGAVANRFKAASVHHPSGIQVTAIAHAGDEFDALWQRISGAYTVLAVRDRAFVQWRFLDCPTAEQHLLLASRGREPLGYLAYRIHRDGEHTRAGVLDYFGAPDDRATAGALLQHLRCVLKARAVES